MMPNLEQNTVTEWLAELRTGSDAMVWPPIIRPIETQRTLPEALAGLGESLDTLIANDLSRLATALREASLEGDLQGVMAQLGAARVMRLLHWMAEVDLADCHEIIARLMRDDGDEARALRASVGAVTRTTTVRRMFAPERVAALEGALTTAMEET